MTHNPDRLRAVVFDWNGTLNDMGVLLEQNKHFARVEFGVRLTDEDVRDCWGLPCYEFFDALFGARIGHRLTPQQIRQRFLTYSDQFPRRLQPEVPPLFDALEAAGIVRGLLTTGPRAEIEQYLREGGLAPERFDFMHMQAEMPGGTPALQSVVGELALRGIGVQEALFVGDEEVNRADAEAAGMDYRIVTNGTRSRATLLEHGVPGHKLIDSVGALLALPGIGVNPA